LSVPPASERGRAGAGNQTNEGDFSFDFDVFVSNVTQLNLLAGEGVARVQRTRDGARLKVCVVNATTLLMLSDTVKATNFWLSMLFSMCFINVVSGPFSL
jgi:hypothetical protein